MSEMAHKKAKLKPVLRYGEYVNIQDWMEMEWSVYCDAEIDQQSAYEVLIEFLASEDFSCNYYLFDDKLYEMVEERTLDEYVYSEAELTSEGISVDCRWYNGGADFREGVWDALKKLEGG